uniref:Uncharacterized protein n=1 Tax=Oryza brachyantha TaxID=4533 RepID=J3MG20_ORYBR
FCRFTPILRQEPHQMLQLLCTAPGHTKEAWCGDDACTFLTNLRRWKRRKKNSENSMASELSAW